MQVTHIFRDVLHGWGQILLSVNISPDAADYDETAHVLKVGIQARQIPIVHSSVLYIERQRLCPPHIL